MKVVLSSSLLGHFISRVADCTGLLVQIEIMRGVILVHLVQTHYTEQQQKSGQSTKLSEFGKEQDKETVWNT